MLAHTSDVQRKTRVFGSRIVVVLALIIFWLDMASCPNNVSGSSASQAARAASPQTTPSWLPFQVPPQLYARWRKYGTWDYKQQGFKYRDYTLFNFGATGSAAGFDEKAQLALVRAAQPGPMDLQSLTEAGLETHFDANANALDQLRVMAEEDHHLTRIAADFTYLDDKNEWPREDVGITDGRWNEYRSLFQKVSLQEGIVPTEDFPGAIFIVAVSRGLCTGGASAGYVYSTKKLSPTSDSPTETLDAEARNRPDRNYAYAFKEEKRNWYLFYELDW